jgi:restriction endonuclease Mrr
MPSAGLPKQADVEIALHRFLMNIERSIEVKEAYRSLAIEFGLDREQQNRLNSEGRSEWENLVRFAKRRLIDNGLAVSVSHGRFQLKTQSKIQLDL